MLRIRSILRSWEGAAFSTLDSRWRFCHAVE